MSLPKIVITASQNNQKPSTLLFQPNTLSPTVLPHHPSEMAAHQHRFQGQSNMPATIQLRTTSTHGRQLVSQQLALPKLAQSSGGRLNEADRTANGSSSGGPEQPKFRVTAAYFERRSEKSIEKRQPQAVAYDRFQLMRGKEQPEQSQRKPGAGSMDEQQRGKQTHKR